VLGRAQTADEQVKQYLAERRIYMTTDNSIELLETGAEKFADLFDYINRARHHIHLEYFNFRHDSIANLLFVKLAEKVREGVQVRILFDGFGNKSNSRPLTRRDLKGIRGMGIEIYEFDPVRFPFINHVFHRDHRKIVVIDGCVGYMGGMNVADYYIEGLPKIGAWHDMHMRIEGSAVYDLQDIFLRTWNRASRQFIGGEAYYPILPLPPGESTVAIVDREPRVNPDEIRDAFIAALDNARETVQIINPYFVPTTSVRRALKRAVDRGVRLEIMVSAKSDISFTPDAVAYITHTLMKRGAQIYINNDGFHHTKIMMVDGTLSFVGSANLNSRSLRYDYETNAFIFDQEITQQLIALFEREKTNSTLMTLEYWKERGLWKNFIGWFANLFIPVL
jgi:cardiolipin synthase